MAEEFDTARLLRCCYEELKARQGDAASVPARTAPPAAGELAALNDKVDALCRAVEELRQIVCAQTMPTKAS